MTPTLSRPQAAIKPGARLHENLDTPQLVERALQRSEGLMSEHGALVVETGKYTGRSAQDKFIVRDAETKDDVWWGPSNKPMTGEALCDNICDHPHLPTAARAVFRCDHHGWTRA